MYVINSLRRLLRKTAFLRERNQIFTFEMSLTLEDVEGSFGVCVILLVITAARLLRLTAFLRVRDSVFVQEHVALFWCLRDLGSKGTPQDYYA